MRKHFVRSWEYVFLTQIPANMEILAEALGSTLQSFQLGMSERAQLTAASSFTLASRQVKNLESSLRDTTDLEARITAGQKIASRLLIEAVGERMARVHTSCARESGENTPLLSRSHRG